MTRHGVLGGLLALGLFTAGNFAFAAEPTTTTIGNKSTNRNSLRDLRGSKRALHSFTDRKALVLVFLGTDCPISNLYLPTLLDLEKKVRPQQVQFLAIYPNETEDLDQVGMHSYDRGVPFPVLKDGSQKLADALGVTRVPTVVVLDGDFTIRYRGRVDDQYGVSFRKPKPTRNDLAVAIEEVLAGKPVSVAETEADGCLLSRTLPQPSATGVTYSKHVA